VNQSGVTTVHCFLFGIQAFHETVVMSPASLITTGVVKAVVYTHASQIHNTELLSGLHTGDAVGLSTYILHLKSPFQHSVTLKDHHDNQNENPEN
jgi:acyl-CoA synthetase (AMP-forming)/AMP-acid ligase II